MPRCHYAIDDPNQAMWCKATASYEYTAAAREDDRLLPVGPLFCWRHRVEGMMFISHTHLGEPCRSEEDCPDAS